MNHIKKEGYTLKITDVKTHVLRCKIREPFGFSQGWYDTRAAMILEIFTDQGIRGWGECWGPPEVASAIVNTVFKPLLIDEDPFDVDKIWEKLYNHTKAFGQKGMTVVAISGVDIALWDIMGKTLSLPIHKLLGGSFRNMVQAYATGLYFKKVKNPIAVLAEEAQEYVQQGFHAIKMKIGLSPEEDLERVRTVRKAIGDDVLLMVDANHAYNVHTAIKLGRELEEQKIFWFEEPVSPEDVRGYAEVTRSLNIPIAGGEAEFTRFGFRELLIHRSVDIIQPDLCITGGISEGKKIAILANTFGIPCIPHAWGTGIALAAALHFIASIPDCPSSANPIPPLLEMDQTSNPLRELLIKNKIKQKDGFVRVPTNPGLGVEVDEEVIKKYSV